jgi:hypothetical protein
MFEYAGAFGENKMEGKNKKITEVNSLSSSESGYKKLILIVSSV